MTKKIEFIEPSEKRSYIASDIQQADISAQSSFKEVQCNDIYWINKSFEILELAYKGEIDTREAQTIINMTDKLIEARKKALLQPHGFANASSASMEIMTSFDSPDFGYLKRSDEFND